MTELLSIEEARREVVAIRECIEGQRASEALLRSTGRELEAAGAALVRQSLINTLRAVETVIAQHEILAGRTTAPTDAEIEAHRRAGGGWRWVVLRDGHPTMLRGESEYPPSVYLTTGMPVRWWALGPDWCLCAWPTVTA